MKKLLLLLVFFSALLNAAGTPKPIGWAENYFADETLVSKAVEKPKVSGLEGKEISTYYIGAYMKAKSVQNALEAAGFTVIAKYSPVKKGTTLVFTDDSLKAEASKEGRAFAGVSRVFVDDKEKMISFTNPVYFGRAFMQKEYNHAVFNDALEKIKAAFPGLKASADKLEYDDLAGYHFMVGMPYYEDPDELGKPNATTADAVAKAKGYKKGKAVIFELKLSETSTLLGYDLGKRTKKFVKKIGRANAAILPWCVSIENGQAKALNAKYYIAISYPLLDMGGFMGIATVPGAITKDLEKAFKK
ncbi:MAG: hypothetical protein U9N39_09905 [Campylobacterota bacterium]|nr:hypothetical protein [Campylobacterota bacterium]